MRHYAFLILLTYSFSSAPLCAQYGGGASETRPLSYGIVYPSYAMATTINPAILAIGHGDHIEGLYRLPYTYNKVTGNIDELKNMPKSPVWLHYAGCPNPIGLGMAVHVLGKDPTVYGAASFGIEKMQVGYILQMNPASDTRESLYSFRIGGSTGTAAAIQWGGSGSDISTVGLGYHNAWFSIEADSTYTLAFNANPDLTVTMGVMIAKSVGVNVGFRSDNIKKANINKDDMFAAAFARFTKNVGFNVYYKQLFGEFVGGLVIDL